MSNPATNPVPEGMKPAVWPLQRGKTYTTHDGKRAVGVYIGQDMTHASVFETRGRTNSDWGADAPPVEYFRCAYPYFIFEACK